MVITVQLANAERTVAWITASVVLSTLLVASSVSSSRTCFSSALFLFFRTARAIENHANTQGNGFKVPRRCRGHQGPQE